MKPRFFLFFLIISLSFSGPAVADEKAAPPPKPDLQNSTSITHQGSNSQALFVDDHSILFVSWGRKHHKDPQIYFKDLTTGKEKRITYQRGNILNGVWLSKDHKIIYSSTTDEDKEFPLALKDQIPRFPSSVDSHFFFHINFAPSEIYQSPIDGDSIERLTHHEGFDGFPAFLEKQNKLYFSRYSDGKIQIFSKDLKNKKKKARSVARTHGHDLGLKVAPGQKKWAWYRFSPDFKSSQIMTSGIDFKQPQFVTLDSGIHWSPTWHPNGKSLIFSAKRAPASHYDLYEVEVASGCERKLTSLAGDEYFPAVSPKGDKLVFTTTVSGSEQIHQTAYPTTPCK